MEPEISLSWSKQPVTSPYSEPGQFIPGSHHISWRLILILWSHLHLCFTSSPFLSSFPTTNPHAPLNCAEHAVFSAYPVSPHGVLSAVQNTKLLAKQVTWFPLFIVINSTAHRNKIFAFLSYAWKIDICKFVLSSIHFAKLFSKFLCLLIGFLYCSLILFLTSYFLPCIK